MHKMFSLLRARPRTALLLCIVLVAFLVVQGSSEVVEKAEDFSVGSLSVSEIEEKLQVRFRTSYASNSCLSGS